MNRTTINLIWKLLSREDYASVAGDLCLASDAKNLLDFMLHLHRSHHLLTEDMATVNIKQRVKQFMMKIISTIPVIPPSLIVTRVRIPIERDRIGIGAFGWVFKGELQGSTIALKVLAKPDIEVLSHFLLWA